jgi:hypothetical protein
MRPWVLVSVLLLSGCGSASSHPDTIPNIPISGSNLTETVAIMGTFDLSVSGSSDVLSIAANETVDDLSVSGSNNTITIGPADTLIEIDNSGTDNIYNVPSGTSYVLNDAGTGTQIVTYTPN